MADWYVDSAQYTNVSQWVLNNAYSAGAIVRQKTAPAVGNERCFVVVPATSCIEGKASAIFSAGTSGSVSITTTAAGDIIVLVVFTERTNAQGSFSTVSSVSGGGLAWARRSQAQSHNGTDPYNNLEVWWAYSSGTLSAASISVTVSATVDDCSLLIFAVKNPASTSSPWDANASLPASSNSSAAPTPSVTVSTTSGTNLRLEFFGCPNSSTPSAGSPGTFFILNSRNSGGTNFSNCAAAAGYFGTAMTGTFAWGNSITQGVFTVDFIPLSSAPAGGTSAATEPTWTVTAGANTTDNTITWAEITGREAYQHQNGVTASWAAPHARLNNACASGWGAAGDTIFVGDDHAETQSTGLTLSAPGTNASPNFIYCVDHTAAVPPGSANLLTSATITSSVGSGTMIGLNGSFYCYGISFIASGSSTGVAINFGGGGSYWQRYDSCALQKTGAGTPASVPAFQFGSGVDRFDLYNTTVKFGNTADSIGVSGVLTWRNTASAIAGATLPTTLVSNFSNAAGGAGNFILEGIDLSALGSGKTLFGAASLQGATAAYLIDCELGSSVTIAATPNASSGYRIDVVRSDSGATSYHQRRYWYEGTLQEETTIVRSGGASDGTTAISWKITTTANSRWVLPFETFPMSIWNSKTSGNVTVTLYGIWGGGAVPNTDDIWMVVEYLGTSGNPLASFANTTKSNNLATGSALSSDSSSWGGSTTAFKMSVTITPKLIGYLRVYVMAAKVSSTFYIDPLPVLT